MPSSRELRVFVRNRAHQVLNLDSYFHVLHRTRSSFLASIDWGCNFCILLRSQLGLTEVDRNLVDGLEAYVALRLKISDEADEDTDFKQPWSIAIISRLGNAVLDVIGGIPGLFKTTIDKLWMHISKRLGSPAIEGTELPARLINVINPRSPFLVETCEGMQVNYVALSYCWGSRPQMMTLKDNVQAHLTNIPVETLSKTCRDAILATHLLEYEYLWVDALCIIQDDDDDKESEILKMGQIYRYAVLTICAEGSPDAHSGLFPQSPTDPREVYPCQMTMSVASDDGPVTRKLTLAGSRHGEDFLSKRGWTLQEEVLTSRALVIGQGIISWRCASAAARETDPVLKSLPIVPYMHDSDDLDEFDDDIPRFPGLSLDIARMRSWLYEFPGARRIASNHRLDANHPAFTAWYALIQGYSDRELKYVKDTLPAVQGIATILESSLATRYVKGLWLADLPRGLLWYVAANDDRPVIGSPTALYHDATGNTKPNIPSWSWATVGKVRIRFCALRYVGEWTATSLAQISLDLKPHLNPGGDQQLMAKGPMKRAILFVSEAFLTWRTGIIYGSRSAHSHESESASVVIDGVHPRYPALLLDPDNKGRVVGEAALDHPLETLQLHILGNSQKTEVTCLFLQQWAGGKECNACLILKSVDNDTTTQFKRLGVGFIGGKDAQEGDEDMIASRVYTHFASGCSEGFSSNTFLGAKIAVKSHRTTPPAPLS
ncbi:hypothetical protein PG991_006374 [Apiospora marii]|uniref:Heterokaryon incompatibility domain-containing protein n=1 Tax=Apiospora marii TaxID=335849 RepID=A0ABR1SBV5_9PEZI